MKRGDGLVILPRWMQLNEMMKGIVPARLRDAALGVLGISHTMEHFTGRPQPQPQQQKSEHQQEPVRR